MPKKNPSRVVVTARPDGAPVRVLVVGGGCAGTAAAWELAKMPGFDIEVIESQLRLGGKGASTRDAHGRIIEHGLHVWLGFYENAFRMMRECYGIVESQGWGPDAALGQRLAHARFDNAFFAEPHIAVAGSLGSEHGVWSGQLPPMPGAPGTPLDPQSNPFSLPLYLAHALALVRALVHSLIGGPQAGTGGSPRPDDRSAADEAMDLDFEIDFAQSPRAAIESLASRLRAGTYVSAATLLQAIAIFEDWLRSVKFAPQVADSAQALVEAITVQVRRQLGKLLSVDPKARWKTTVIDLVMTIFVGLYRDRVLWHADGLDSLNRFDYRSWLKKHGASYDALESPFLRGIYDLVFAYRDGDPARPALAAGVALRGALRMFLSYRGAMFWRMRSGMGDAVFAPLYKVLATAPRHADGPLRSPVRFRFGCQLDRLDFDRPVAGRERVRSARFLQHHALAEGMELDHFGCWPADGQAKRIDPPRPVLRRAERDFDVIVFACGPEALGKACAELHAKAPQRLERWRTAIEHAHTVGTRSAQLWLDRSLEQLGWLRGPVVLSALGAPLETWADMTHALASEQDWRDALAADNGTPPQTTAARSLAYLCGVDNRDEAAYASSLLALLEGQPAEARPAPWTRALWPKAFAGGTVVSRLVDAAGLAVGEPALIQQHWARNDEGSERYSQSLPGSVEHRISPLDDDVGNATLAGDWTACGLDAGCIEAAVISGLLAAHAVTGGMPALATIVGYDHP